MDIHLRDLRYFVAVAQDRHFTRAAERLFVSQPALSKQIRALERQLGSDLFVRERREVALTEPGDVLLAHALRVLAEWDEADAALQAYRTAQASTLVVGMSTGPGRGGLLPAIRSRFTAAHSGVVLQLRQVSWADPTAGLADGTADVAFVWLPLPDADRYRSLIVAEEARVVAMADHHPLADRDSIAPADLFGQPMLALPAEAGAQRDHWLLTEQHAGHPVAVAAVVRTIDETYEALLDGLGVVVLAAGNTPLLMRGGIVIRPLIGVAPSRLALAWRRDDSRPAVAGYVRAAEQVVRLRTVRSASDDHSPP